MSQIQCADGLHNNRDNNELVVDDLSTISPYSSMTINKLKTEKNNGELRGMLTIDWVHLTGDDGVILLHYVKLNCSWPKSGKKWSSLSSLTVSYF